MKEALAVVSIVHETATQQNAVTLKKSFSAPRLTANVGSTTLNGKRVTVNLSGEVRDDYAGLVQTSAHRNVHVFRGSEYLGDIALSTQNDGVTDYAPYAKHFTFSGSVTSDAWMGSLSLVVITDTNEMGAHGRVEIPITLNGTQPIPYLVGQVSINIGAGLSPTTVNSITLTSPDVGAGGVLGVISLTETGVDTNVFTATGGWLVNFGNPVSGSATGLVIVNDDVRYSGIFTQTTLGVYSRSDYWVPLFSGPTNITYNLSWNKAWSSSTTMGLVLPSVFGASGTISLTGQGNTNGTGSWSGSFNGNSLNVNATSITATAARLMGYGSIGSNVTQCSLMSISVNGVVVVNSISSDCGVNGGVTSNYTVSDPYEVASYSIENVSAVETQNRNMGEAKWEPYRVRIDVPDSLGDGFVTGRSWVIQGSPVTVEKLEGKWYVKDAVSGKPTVYIDPSLTPTTDPRDPPGSDPVPSNDDVPLPEGWASYRGESGGVQVVLYQTVGKNQPDTISVWVRYSTDKFIAPRVVGDGFEVAHYIFNEVGARDPDALNIRIQCQKQKVQATPATLVGKPTTPDMGKLIFSGFLQTCDAGPECWKWKAAEGEDISIGWQWVAGYNQEICTRPALWTLPDWSLPDNDGRPGSVSLTMAVAKALGEDRFPEPSTDVPMEQKRIVLSHLTAMVGKGAINHFDIETAKKLYEWMLNNVFDSAFVGNGIVPKIKNEYLTLHALDIKKVTTAFDKAENAFLRAKWEKDVERGVYARWTLAGQPFDSPGAYITLIDSLNNVDPFAAGVTLAAGEPLVPVSENATWIGVPLAIGCLVIDRIPFARLARKGKLIFRKATQLPEACRPIRKFAKEELVVAGKKVKNIVEQEANNVNHAYIIKGDNPPYVPNSKILEFTTEEPVKMVRFHGLPNQRGSWMAEIPEAMGEKSDEQIRQLLALKRMPTHFSIVEVPAGVRMRRGRVNAQPEWGVPNHGGTQFELTMPDSDLNKLKFLPPKPISEWSLFQ